tara:strand:+ start:3032 stop:3214 length:183 start_codon:yes stop_codon:yes gene_type:complete
MYNLTDITLNDSLITGDLSNFKYMINLYGIYIADTDITANEELFNEYRESVGLEMCYIEF